MTQDELSKRRRAARQSTDYSPTAAAESRYQSPYDSRRAQLIDRYDSRGDFDYRPSADPLYRSYRDRYTRDGELAMRDSSARAAALTGGYMSSYAQGVGQQQYGEYLRRLSDAMPALYSAAYDRYTAEGDSLLEQIDRLGAESDRDYARHRDAIADERYSSQLAAQDEKLLYDRRKDAYERLLTLLAQGYEPSDEELEDAGMSREEAKLLTPSTGGGSYYYSSGKKSSSKDKCCKSKSGSSSKSKSGSSGKSSSGGSKGKSNNGGSTGAERWKSI